MTDKAQMPDETGADEAYFLNADHLDAIRDAVDARDGAALGLLLAPLHAADVADLLEQLSPGRRQALLSMWSAPLDGNILSELDDALRDEVIAALPRQTLADAVRELDSDDVVDLVEDMDAPQRDAILSVLDDTDRVAAERALDYPDYTAGRLMQRELVMAPEHWTVGQAIDNLREAEDLPEQFYHIILVNPRLNPVAYVTLGKVLSAPRSAPLADLTEDSFRTIPVLQESDDIAYAFNQYHLISAPVVDADNRLVGVITIDDAMILLEEEADEDMKRLAGVGDESLSDRTWAITKQRFPWLAVNLVTAVLASMVIAQFEGVIAQVVALAVLMPIVASMGGNAGTQSLTVAVRALATKDLTRENTLRVLTREVAASLLNGLAFALVVGIVGLVWFGSVALGGVIAAAMVINLVVAGFAGLLIPIALERLGVDPALASGAFVTTVTDVVGFFAFLGLAATVLI